jgi:secreted trypsin-like serine protease
MAIRTSTIVRGAAPYLAVSLAASLVAALTACGHASPPDASATKIRQGHLVAADALGPERVSTVALSIATARSYGSCSAAILTDRLLVTAAHCADTPSTITAFFGLDLDDPQDTDVAIRVTGRVVNPDYDAASPVFGLPLHDVAVLRLARPIPAGFAPTPVLAAGALLESPQAVRLAGYGITERGTGSALRSVDTTYVGTDDYGRLSIVDDLHRGACSGDSGGPLFVAVADGWRLAGVLSGGPIPCRGVNTYTPLAAHRAFLNDAVQTLAPATLP